MLNSKLETRNPKFETNSNEQKTKQKILPMKFRLSVFGTWFSESFGFVSDFEIRISDFYRGRKQ